jgi:hypothetical protein
MGIVAGNGLSIGNGLSFSWYSQAPSLSLKFYLMSSGANLTGAGVTFSRASSATMFDGTGKLTYAPSNLYLFSEQFDNAAWNKTRSTITANAATAPDGTLTADKLVEDTTVTNTHRISQAVSYVAGGALTTSVYAKAGERTAFIWRGDTTNFSANGNASFDLVTGIAVAAAPFTSAVIESVGGGWYRCSATAIPNAGLSTVTVYIDLLDASGNRTYTGDGTSGLYLWGAQIEAMTYQTAPSTYVATTASAYYSPRFDYNPVTLAANGLLIEEARTNLFTYSDQFDNATWTKTGATISPDVVGSPDGTTMGDKVVESATTAAHGFFKSVTVSAGATSTVTIYAQAGERSLIFLALDDGTNTNQINCTYNLSNGSAGSIAYAGAGANGVATIAPVGNGWYRLRLTGTPSAAATTARLTTYIRITTANSTYAGDGTSGLYVWGAQLEGAAFATSYIPTVASSVTRAADSAVMTGASFSSWYNQAEGTFVTLFDTPASSTRSILGVDDNTANEMVRLLTEGADPYFKVVDGGVEQVSLDAGTVAAEPFYKFAAAYKVNDFAASISGQPVVTSSSGTLPTPDRARIGADQAGNILCGHVRSLAYYNVRLSNGQLMSLTS